MNFYSPKLLEQAEWLGGVLEEECEAYPKPRTISLSEMRRDLVKLHPIFGVHIDFGWRPRMGFNGSAFIFDGTIPLLTDSRYSPRDDENPKVVWLP